MGFSSFMHHFCSSRSFFFFPHLSFPLETSKGVWWLILWCVFIFKMGSTTKLVGPVDPGGTPLNVSRSFPFEFARLPGSPWLLPTGELKPVRSSCQSWDSGGRFPLRSIFHFGPHPSRETVAKDPLVPSKYTEGSWGALHSSAPLCPLAFAGAAGPGSAPLRSCLFLDNITSKVRLQFSQLPALPHSSWFLLPWCEGFRLCVPVLFCFPPCETALLLPWGAGIWERIGHGRWRRRFRDPAHSPPPPPLLCPGGVPGSWVPACPTQQAS